MFVMKFTVPAGTSLFGINVPDATEVSIPLGNGSQEERQAKADRMAAKWNARIGGQTPINVQILEVQ